MNGQFEKLNTTFVAIELPRSIREQLVRLQSKLAKVKSPMSWELPDKLHITISYLGKITPRQMQSAQKVLTKMVSEFEPFVLRIQHLGYFFEKQSSSVIWIGVDSEGHLERFHKRFTKELNREDFCVSEHKLYAHVTLGRLRRTPQKDQRRIMAQMIEQDIDFVEQFTVQNVSLLASKFHRDLATTEFSIIDRYAFSSPRPDRKTMAEIYANYQIIPNLQLHMYRVAAVGKFLSSKWKSGGPRINRQAIIRALLLHDIGNIIKFDFKLRPELLGSELKHLDFWKQIQKEFVEKYGKDEYLATRKIAVELNMPHTVTEILEKIGSSNLFNLVESEDWEAKLCTYADLRVSPVGVVSINQRFVDIIERYHGSNHPLADKEKTLQKRDQALILESQIQEKVDFNLAEISDDLIRPVLEKLPIYLP